MFTFFTEVLKKDVVDRHGRWVGYPYDFTAKLDEAYPRLTSLIVARSWLKKSYCVIPWSEVVYAENRFELKLPAEKLERIRDYRRDGDPTLRINILDQQVVDTFNRKVVRVNDLQFLSVGGELRIAHVDVGIRGLVRRLGWERMVDILVRVVNRHSSYLESRGLIAWKYVQPLSIQDAAGRIQLNVEQQSLSQIPPSDISEMLTELDPYQRTALLTSLEVHRQVAILTELDLKMQRDLIEDLETRTAVHLFEQMPADEATDLLQILSKRDASRVMEGISTRKSRELSELMAHETDSAGGMMTKEFVVLSESMDVGEAVEHVRKFGGKAETIHAMFVVDEQGKLMGTVMMRQLVLEPIERKVTDLMLPKPPMVSIYDSLKDVAYELDKYNLFVIPAVDEQGVLEGIITIDDVLSRVVAEAWGEERSGL